MSRLCLVENFGDNQLTIFLLFIISKVVLMHYPICFLGFLLLPIICVKDKYLLVTFEFSFNIDRPSLACFVPPCLATFFICMDLSSFSIACCICLRRSVKEVSDLPIFANPYIAPPKKKRKEIYIIIIIK